MDQNHLYHWIISHVFVLEERASHLAQKKKWPLTASFAIKGHFCSLLISNIFCYPLFLLRYLSLIRHNSKNSFLLFLYQEYRLFSFALLLQKGLGFLFQRLVTYSQSELNHRFCFCKTHKSVLTRHTAVFFLPFLPAPVACILGCLLELKSWSLTCHWTVPSFLHL